MNGLVGNQSLVEAKQLLEQYRAGTEPPGTTETQVTRDTLLVTRDTSGDVTRDT